MTNAELILAIKTANDDAVEQAVDIQTDNAAAITAALKSAADELNVEGTSAMTDAELITAIKTANDEVVKVSNDTEVMISDAELAIRVAADNDTATNTAVSNATAFDTLAELLEAYNNLANPASFTLTTGVNNFSTTRTESVAFDASTVNSLSNGDVLSGGSATDTLTANLSNITVSVNSTGIEVFTLNVAAAGAATLDMTDVTGLTTVNNVSSLNNLTLNNLGMLPSLDLNTNSAVTTLNFSNAAMSGGTDDLAITLNGTTSGATINLTSVAGSANTIETVSVVSASVPNTIDLNTNAVGATTVEVTGSQNLDLGTVESLVATVSAGDFTGNLTMTAGTAGTAITSGAGADILTGNAGSDNLITGDGIDTVNMTNGGDDQVNLGAGADNLNDAENIAAADTVVGGAGSDTLTFGDNWNVGAADLALTSGFDVIALEDDTGNNSIQVGLDDTVVGASDSDTITINGAGTNDTVTLTAAVSAGNTVILGDDGASFTLAGNTRATIGILDSNTADGDLSNETSTEVTLGAGDEILTGSDGQDTVNMTNGGDDNVSLGAGADNLNDAENIGAADVIVGGAGSDTLTFSNNSDVAAANLALTSGFDVIALEDDTNNSAIAVGLDDTVVGASDSDTITINGATGDTVTLTAAVSAGNTVILGDDGASFTLAGNTRATIGILDSGTADGDLSNETSTAVSLGAGDEILTGSDGQDTVNMTNGGDDNVSLGAGADNLNDAENIGAADVIVGGAGSDTLTFSDDSDVAAANLALTSGFDVIALEDDTNDGAITVGLDDTVVGASDSDTITINGAGTNDTVTLTAAVSAGNTVILGDDGASFTLAGNTRATIGILDSGTADGDLSNETSTAVSLGAGDEILTGSDGQDTVNMTNGGDDNVSLGAGADNLNDAENIGAADVIVGGAGSDTLTFSDDSDVAAANLALTSGFDVIALEDDTNDGAITVGLDDTVVGASDSDTITINGAGTNDTVTLTAAVSAGNTVILGDDGASFTLAGNTRATIGILDSGTADGDLSNETSTAVSLGAGDEILTGSDGQDTVNMTNGGDDNVSLGAGADNLNDAENIGAADVIVGGAGSDTLTFSDDSDVAAANLALTSGFDVIALEDDTNDGAITVGLDDTVVGASDSDTITINGAGTNDTVTLTAAVSAGNTVILGDDGASFTLAGNTRATIGILDSNTADGDLSNETSTTVTLGAGNEIVTGSDGQDTVVLGTGAATVSLGAGVDTFSVTDADLTGFNVLNGGDGDDVLSIIDDTNLDTIVDNDFTGKTSIEALTLNNDDANSITLGSKAAATGIATVTLGSGDDDLTVDSGYTGSITVDGSANGANTISLANSSAAASVTGGTGVDTITAGSGDITIVDAGADADVIVAGSGTMTITDAGAGADVVTGSTGALIITDAGAGADEFTVSTGQFNITAGADGDVLIISNGDLTSDDTFAGGAGSDVIRIDNATTLVDKDFTNVTSTFTLNSAVADVALDVTLGAEANEAGLVDIDGGTASDVIDGAGMTLDLDIDDEGGNNTITGGAGNDNIATGAGADSITGGAGNDTLSGGNGADIYVFSSTGALNGDDTITFVQADDRLDFSSFLSGGSVENNTVPVAATGTDDIQLNNKLIILDDASADLTATEVAAAIEGIGDAMELSDGGKGIVIVADAADANSDMSIFYVDDSLGANVGTVELDDVVLVGQSSAGIDADSLANGNFIF